MKISVYCCDRSYCDMIKDTMLQILAFYLVKINVYCCDRSDCDMIKDATLSILASDLVKINVYFCSLNEDVFGSIFILVIHYNRLSVFYVCFLCVFGSYI